ncbi:hypothetical protein FRB95_014027 [Tulasnella sp. JGI-2019a]|nr:hypothetical protein FRB95_014027 [Tulasnella sp. JGI-2019a]
MPTRFAPSPTTSLAEVVASRKRSRTPSGSRHPHPAVRAIGGTGRNARGISVPPTPPPVQSTTVRASTRPPNDITAECVTENGPSPLSSAVDISGSHSPDVKPEPADFFAKIRGSRGENAIRIDLTEDEEVEALLQRSKKPKPKEESLKKSESLPPKPGTNLLIRLITWPIKATLMIWLGVLVLAATQKILRDYYSPQPVIPLEYITWSIGSNAVHARDIMQQMLPIRQIGRVVWNKASVERLAMDLERLSKDPEPANTMRQYIKSIDTLNDEIRPMNLKANIAVRDIVKDLSKSDKLIKRLYPHRRDSSHPPSPEVISQLMHTLSKLYVDKLPTNINALYTSFLPAQSQMHRISGMVQELITALGDDHVTNVLQLKPPTVWRSSWEKNDDIQRRVKHASATVESFQRMMDLEKAFEGTKVALWKYRQSLGLFEDPWDLHPNHRRSNGTFADFVVRLRHPLLFVISATECRL